MGRRRIRTAAGILAAVVPVVGLTAGAAPGSAAPHRSAAPTVYAAYVYPGLPLAEPSCTGYRTFRSALIPVSTATNKAGKPISVGGGDQVAITPNGKTAYVLNYNGGTVIPVSIATHKAGKPIPLGHDSDPFFIAITPNGKTVYVTTLCQHTVVPISTATNTAGKPIRVGRAPIEIAITPNGKTAYVLGEPDAVRGGTVTPISTATNTAGKRIHVHSVPFQIAITPNGKTAYVDGGRYITPISTATNTAATPIHIHHGEPGVGEFAITPDGKTAYALTHNPNTVVPISTATNTVGTPIKVSLDTLYFPLGGLFGLNQFAIPPDGKTAYLVAGTKAIIPINTATNTAGKTIRLPGCHNYPLVYPDINIAITSDGKTAYVACEGAIVPLNLATNTPGKPIPVQFRQPGNITITP